MDNSKLWQLKCDLRNISPYLVSSIELESITSEKLFITFSLFDKRYTIQVTVNEMTDLYDISVSEFGFGIMQTRTTDDAKACIEDILAKYNNLDLIDLYILNDVLKDRMYSEMSNNTILVFSQTGHFNISVRIVDGIYAVIIHGMNYQSKEYRFDSGYKTYNFIANIYSLYLDEEFEGAEDLITLYANLYLELGGSRLYLEKDELSDCNINIEYFLKTSEPVKLNFNKFDYGDDQIQCCIWEDEYNVMISDLNCVVRSPEDAANWAKSVVDEFNKGEL